MFVPFSKNHPPAPISWVHYSENEKQSLCAAPAKWNGNRENLPTKQQQTFLQLITERRGLCSCNWLIKSNGEHFFSGWTGKSGSEKLTLCVVLMLCININRHELIQKLLTVPWGRILTMHNVAKLPHKVRTDSIQIVVTINPIILFILGLTRLRNLQKKTFSYPWGVNTICLIFCHWWSSVLYSVRYWRKKSSTSLPLSFLHNSSNTALLWLL